ncbi:hypothetical protein EX30DRAFT_363640 [Ascodesmis nigricans]|uniref:DUF1772-domain-containing protein n=1 Tax=Ascodesmis nigricans TaxID=341454 RepID=A0A4S2MYI9_9PEZI|nr:hypothetical protein EX30DRAFT_363640 [Ascodesmis nigricans]
MSTPTPNTMLPQAVRIAKLVGTVGSAYAAGSYLTTTLGVLPSLSHQPPRDLALTLSNLHQRLRKPLLIATTAASTAFGYVAYILYSTPTLLVPLASITTSPSSFLPHAEATDLVIGGGWEFYAAAAAVLAAVVPWQLVVGGKVEERLEGAARASVAGREVGEEVQRKKRAGIGLMDPIYDLEFFAE